MASDRAGNLVFADTDNHRVRVIAAKSGTFYGQSMHTGSIYTIAGTGAFGYTGDGGSATSAKMGEPDGIAIDGVGNIVLTDADGSNDAVRVVAEKSGAFYGQSMTAGHIYSLVGKHCNGGALGDGGPASQACVQWPTSVAVDGTGNLIVADHFNNRVRLIAAKSGTFYGHSVQANHIVTVNQGSAPTSVLVDSHDNILISSTKVRVLAGRTGTFYAQKMTSGHLYSIAGTGAVGFSGDGGPATHAQLSSVAVSLDRNGTMFIADDFSNRVRAVSY